MVSWFDSYALLPNTKQYHDIISFSRSLEELINSFHQQVKEYLGDESRGPYRSTYYETYVIDGRKPGAVSIQV